MLQCLIIIRITLADTPRNEVSIGHYLRTLTLSLLEKKPGSQSSPFSLKRIRDFVSSPTLHCIYNALIQSQLDYCNIVWGNCEKTLFDRL